MALLSLLGLILLFLAALSVPPADARGPGWGRVFVFNTTGEDVRIEINRQELPKLLGTSRHFDYVPAVLAVDRTTMTPGLAAGEFAERTGLRVVFPDGVRTYEIVIDGARFGIEQDLQLYVRRGSVELQHAGVAVADAVQPLDEGEIGPSASR